MTQQEQWIDCPIDDCGERVYYHICPEEKRTWTYPGSPAELEMRGECNHVGNDLYYDAYMKVFEGEARDDYRFNDREYDEVWEW